MTAGSQESSLVRGWADGTEGKSLLYKLEDPSLGLQNPGDTT